MLRQFTRKASVRGWRKSAKPHRSKKRTPYMWRGKLEEFGEVYGWNKDATTCYISFKRAPHFVRRPGYAGWDCDRHRWVVRPFMDNGPIPRIAGTWRYNEFGPSENKIKSKKLRRMRFPHIYG